MALKRQTIVSFVSSGGFVATPHLSQSIRTVDERVVGRSLRPPAQKATIGINFNLGLLGEVQGRREHGCGDKAIGQSLAPNCFRLTSSPPSQLPSSARSSGIPYLFDPTISHTTLIVIVLQTM